MIPSSKYWERIAEPFISDITSQSKTVSLSFAPQFESEQRLDVTFLPMVSISKSRTNLHEKHRAPTSE